MQGLKGNIYLRAYRKGFELKNKWLNTSLKYNSESKLNCFDIFNGGKKKTGSES